MFTKILVPFDGSAHSQKALEVAAELARCTKGAVHVIYAYERLPSYLGEPNFDDMVTRVLGWANEIVKNAVAQAQEQGVAATSDILEGPPAEAILRVAEAEEFDVIVMGSRGLGQFEGLLMGSVSDRVLHHAHIPVMVVR
jgi:nucleotide-binding universal stress UspA family protein